MVLNINPSKYPEWLGGDSIMEVDDDNILFDLDGVNNILLGLMFQN